MCSSLHQLAPGSRDLYQAEKKRTSCKAEQINKTPTVFTQNGPRLLFLRQIVVILLIFSALDKPPDPTAN